MHPARPAARLAVAAALLFLAAGAGASDFFGPPEGLQLQPELDVYHHVTEGFRLQLRLAPTFIPSQGYAEAGVSVYAAFLVAPFTDALLSPDLAKRRRLDVRLGVSWYPTVAPGTQGWSDLLRVEGEATGRTNVAGGVLATIRGRVEAQWQLDQPTSFIWRLRIRPQLEREFALSAEAGTSLTPFANVEFIWTTAQDMWSQFRMQAGIQLGAHWFGRGQVVELNGSIFTYLQPARSSSPVLGLVWYQYF
jgi:hypothetical protein